MFAGLGNLSSAHSPRPAVHTTRNPRSRPVTAIRTLGAILAPRSSCAGKKAVITVVEVWDGSRPWH